MAIVKGSFESEFVTLYNHTARDTRLSLQARGLLLYLLSLPGDWKVNRKQLAKDNHINEKTVQKFINELKDAGYIEYVRERENGRLKSGDYHVYPVPQKTSEKNTKKTTQKTLQANKSEASTTDPNFGRVEILPGGNPTHIQKKDINKTTTTEAKRTKVPISAFVDQVSEAMTGSPVPVWFVVEASGEIWGQYKFPRVSHAIKIILDDWKALDKKQRQAG